MNINFISFSQLKNVDLGIYWGIYVVIVAALLAVLYIKMILQGSAYPKLLHSQKAQAEINDINHNISEIKFLIASQTINLEYIFNKIQSELSKRLQSEESLVYVFKAFEEASAPLCITDNDGNIIDINKAFLKLFDYSRDDLNADGGFFNRFVKTELGQEIHNIILNGYTWKGEVEIRVHYGEVIQVELYATTVETLASQVIGLLFMITNFTEDKQIKAALRDFQKINRTKKLKRRPGQTHLNIED